VRAALDNQSDVVRELVELLGKQIDSDFAPNDERYTENSDAITCDRYLEKPTDDDEQSVRAYHFHPPHREGQIAYADYPINKGTELSEWMERIALLETHETAPTVQEVVEAHSTAEKQQATAADESKDCYCTYSAVGVPTSTRYPNVTRQIDVASDKRCPFIRYPLVLVEQRTIFFSVALLSFCIFLHPSLLVCRTVSFSCSLSYISSCCM
jgi:hypothetical protein